MLLDICWNNWRETLGSITNCSTAFIIDLLKKEDRSLREDYDRIEIRPTKSTQVIDELQEGGDYEIFGVCGNIAKNLGSCYIYPNNDLVTVCTE